MIKIILIALVCSFIIIYLKYSKSEYEGLAIIASSILLIFCSLDYVGQVIEFITKLIYGKCSETRQKCTKKSKECINSLLFSS